MGEDPCDLLKSTKAEDATKLEELERLKRTLKPPTRNTIRTEQQRRKRALITGISEADYIRQKRKDKKRKRQEKRRKEYEELTKNMTPEELERQAEQGKLKKQAEIKRLQLAMTNGQRIAIDLGYVKHCTERDMKSIVKQFAYMQRPNREHEKPFAIHLTSCNLLWREALKKTGGLNWKMHFHEKPVFEMFPKDQLVYLSPDAEQDLTELSQEKVYVIGGIVDRTVKKGLSLRRAKDYQVEVRRLPLGKIRLLGKNVLNIDTMIEVLLNFQISSDWTQILRDYLPARFLHPDELEHRTTPYFEPKKKNTKAKNRAKKNPPETKTTGLVASTSKSSGISAPLESDVKKESTRPDTSKAALQSDTPRSSLSKVDAAKATSPSDGSNTNALRTSAKPKTNADFRAMLGL